MLIEKGVRVGDTDHGKVTLLVNFTLNEKVREAQEKELEKIKKLCIKYGDQGFSAFGQVAYDLKEAEKMTNKEIAHHLNKLGYLDD